MSAAAQLPRSVEYVDAGDTARVADGVAQVYAGELLAVIVRGVIPEDVVAAAVERLERGDTEIPQYSAPVFTGAMRGLPVVLAEDQLEQYYDDAAAYPARIDALFQTTPGFSQRINEALVGLAGGRPASVPVAPDGRRYLEANIRGLVPGDKLPLHFENATVVKSTMRHLSELIDVRAVMSFYLPLTIPDGGGELIVYEKYVSEHDDGDSSVADLGGEEAALPVFRAMNQIKLLPGVGDLMVFDGGRWYHDVTTIEGPRKRWTAGGFLAMSRDHDAVYYWC